MLENKLSKANTYNFNTTLCEGYLVNGYYLIIWQALKCFLHRKYIFKLLLHSIEVGYKFQLTSTLLWKIHNLYKIILWQLIAIVNFLYFVKKAYLCYIQSMHYTKILSGFSSQVLALSGIFFYIKATQMSRTKPVDQHLFYISMNWKQKPHYHFL